MPPAIMPQDVDDILLAFPATVTHLMPKYEDIPEEFKSGNGWTKLVSAWFFTGLEGISFLQKRDIDPQKALRHIMCIISSFEPKHEHKEAACAYLLSLWFEDIFDHKTKISRITGKQVVT